MQIAIYRNQHYKVIGQTDLLVSLLDASDSIIEVAINKVQIFRKLIKGNKKRKRINPRIVKAKKELSPELLEYSNKIAEQVKQFREMSYNGS